MADEQNTAEQNTAEQNPSAQETTAQPAPQATSQPESAPEPASAAGSPPASAPPKKHPKELESAFPFSVIVGTVYDGPLDLLLDLIRKQDIDIYDIPIAKITAQFLGYVEHLKETDVDVAGDFIYMAALLIHIKSKMLLPRSPIEEKEGLNEDPRHELVERLLEHERFKNAAQMLHAKQQIEEATWTNPGIRDFRNAEGTEPELDADTMDLVRVFQQILERAKNRPILNLEEDAATVGQMIQFMRRRLMMEDKPVPLSKLLVNAKSRSSIVAMFLALLELVRLQAILLRQDRNFTEIYVKKQDQFETVLNERISQMRDDWS